MEHPWDLSPEEAIALQRQLSSAVIQRTTFDPDAVETVAGVDVSFPEGMARAAVVVLSFPDLQPLAGAVAEVLVEHAPAPMVRVGVRDCYGECGTNEGLLCKYHLAPSDIADAARTVVARAR